MTSPSSKTSWLQKPRLAAVCVLFLLPLSLRLFPIEHGMPRNYVPDTHVVRNALGMARDKNLVPPAGTYSSYPYGISYMLLPLYATQYAVGRATGQWGGAQEFGNRLKEHPEEAHKTARYFVAFLGALLSVVVYRIAREVGLRQGAWIAAWLTSTSVLNLQYTTQEKAWGPVLFFMVLTAWPAVRYAKSGRLRPLLVSGLCAGLAASCHQSGLWALGLVGLAWIFGPQGWSGADLKRRLLLGVSSVAVFALVALCVGYPFRLLHGATPEGMVSGHELADQASWHISIGGQKQALGFAPGTIAKMTSTFCGYDLVLAVLAPLGLWRALRLRDFRPALWFSIVWALFYWTNPTFFIRYALPMTALFAIPIGALLEDLWKEKRTRIAVHFALVFPLLMACRFVYVLSQEDTRALAEAKLAELPEGALVGIGRHGPAPPLDERSLRLLARIRATPLQLDETGTRFSEPGGLRSRESHRLAHYEANAAELIAPGLPVLPLEEILAFEQGESGVHLRPFKDDAFGESPLEAMARLGLTHMVFVDFSPGVLEVGELSPEVLLPGAEPLWVIDPSRGETPTREARLPLEMRFPLTSLWSVDRPGPKLSLYALPSADERK